MDWRGGRIVVMQPDAVAEATVVDRTHRSKAAELVRAHDMILFLAHGEGTYEINGQAGILRPNTLIAAPAGAFACTLSDDRELYVLSVRDPAITAEDQRAFMPFFDRRLSAAEGRRWHERMMESTARVTAGLFDASDVARIKNDVQPYRWQRDADGVHARLDELFASLWSRLSTPLTLDRLAEGVGYTANYLNDLTREHTGLTLGRWVTDMRMARARAVLEQTDLPVADVGVACGYDDPAYFSRVFRRVHGVPPATWRIAARPVDARYARVTIPLDVMREVELRRFAAPRAYSFAS
jgi:AraC-like DNA-binding protein